MAPSFINGNPVVSSSWQDQCGSGPFMLATDTGGGAPWLIMWNPALAITFEGRLESATH